jgi:transposase-like protein
MARTRGRDLRKERYWRRLLAEWQRSGLSIRAFCASQDVSEQSLYWWRRELAARDRQAARAASVPPAVAAACFVPVHVRSDQTAALPAGVVEVVLGNGRRLRAASDVSGQRLAELALALEAASC